jgi:hypothetical protein
MMGVCGLWCFIVGYARVRNDLVESHGALAVLSVVLDLLFPLQAQRFVSICLSFLFLWPSVSSEAGLCIPDGIAVLAGLAVQETQLLERFAEDVFAAHFEGCAG